MNASLFYRFALRFLAVSCLSAMILPETTPAAPLDFEPVDESRSRTVPLRVFLPQSVDGKKSPVVVFSHGLGGSRDGNDYLGDAWAAAGYAGIFVQHPGSDEALWKDKSFVDARRAMLAGATAEQLGARLADVEFVLALLERWNREPGHALHARLDLERTAMSGHSFGAVTTQTIMSRNQAGFDAYILMSPSKFAAIPSEKAFGHVRAPVFCMTGTRDANPLKPDQPPTSRLAVFRNLPPGSKYQVVFDEGQHSIFSGREMRTRRNDPRYRPAITRLTVTYLDAVLRGDSAAVAWLASDAPKTDGVLEPADRWMWK